MEHRNYNWLEKVVLALGDAQSAVAPFGVQHPILIKQIEAALIRAETLEFDDITLHHILSFLGSLRIRAAGRHRGVSRCGAMLLLRIVLLLCGAGA